MTSTRDGGVTVTAASFVERSLRPARDAGVCDARAHGRLDQLILIFGLDINTRISGRAGSRSAGCACGIRSSGGGSDEGERAARGRPYRAGPRRRFICRRTVRFASPVVLQPHGQTPSMQHYNQAVFHRDVMYM